MIITRECLNSEIKGKIKELNDTICLINLVNTEGELGVVCYIMQNELGEKTWQPFNVSVNLKARFKAKNYKELINLVPPLGRDSTSRIKGAFYNTFDTPVEVNNEILTTIFEVVKKGAHLVLNRKTYYLITDVQELERTFNSCIMPCEIININQINDLINGKKVDESLIHLVKTILS